MALARCQKALPECFAAIIEPEQVRGFEKVAPLFLLFFEAENLAARKTSLKNPEKANFVLCQLGSTDRLATWRLEMMMTTTCRCLCRWRL